ncbi:MAG TPA: DUF1573 domain-containing protein [Flavobacterium sp.]|nr:DUF1573 domain-containing protein [Flavobacterium sp.]
MMIKKIVCLFAVAALTLTASCKKVEKSSNEMPPLRDVTSGQPVAVAPIEGTTPTITPPADGKYPVMTFAHTEHDFGMINAGDKVTYTFDFKNTGEADLLISDAKGSCGCTIPEYPKEPVKPGDSGQIKVSFNSAGKKGEQMKSVNITANTVTGKEVIKIKASINPKAE